jgi:putative flavoprotein involved in K+ transport
VLERGRIAERWRTERWDGLRFQFPNWSVRLPDFPFRHVDPDAFATSADIVDFLTAYAAFVRPPVRCGVTVTRLSQADEGSSFLAETSAGQIMAANVVAATGPYQRPVIPDLLRDASIFQVHASGYREPTQLPRGAVLVVGSAASGAQITEELVRSGRCVYLSVGRHRRMPRRYRGRDLIWWLSTLGLDQTPVERRGPDTTCGADPTGNRCGVTTNRLSRGHPLDHKTFLPQQVTGMDFTEFSELIPLSFVLHASPLRQLMRTHALPCALSRSRSA